jgi:hypothetical protein
MQNTLTQLFYELLATLKKSSVSFIVLIGFASAGARQLIDSNKNHTYGQRVVIILMGGIVAYLVGGIATTFEFSHEWLSLIGFMCGFFGHSIMKYIIDNEQAAFHTISTGLAKLIDLAVDKIASWIPSKKSNNENES